MVNKDVYTSNSRFVCTTHLSVAEASLCLDLSDDGQLSEINFKPFVNIARNLLLRAPRSTVPLSTNPAHTVIMMRVHSKLPLKLHVRHIMEKPSMLFETIRH